MILPSLPFAGPTSDDPYGIRRNTVDIFENGYMQSHLASNGAPSITHVRPSDLHLPTSTFDISFEDPDLTADIASSPAAEDFADFLDLSSCSDSNIKSSLKVSKPKPKPHQIRLEKTLDHVIDNKVKCSPLAAFFSEAKAELDDKVFNANMVLGKIFRKYGDTKISIDHLENMPEPFVVEEMEKKPTKKTPNRSTNTSHRTNFHPSVLRHNFNSTSTNKPQPLNLTKQAFQYNPSLAAPLSVTKMLFGDKYNVNHMPYSPSQWNFISSEFQNLLSEMEATVKRTHN